jgi:YbbR domain-containing protein
VDVRLEPLVRREVPVQYVVSGELPLGYRSGTPRLDPETIILSGPQSAVDAVDQARVELNINGAVETIERTLPVDFLDSEGNPVTGLSASTKEVDVVQPVSLLGRFKNVAVKIVTTGQVANGYRLTNISVSPPTFTVFSENPDLINDIPGFIETMPVDLTNLADDAAISIDLNLPEGITTVREPSVMVQVSVAAIEGSLTLSLPIDIVGLEPGLQATVSPDTVDVIIAGPLFVLDRLTPENFRVVIDVTGLPPGVYQRAPVVELAPEQVRIQTTLPETVELTIEIAPTPTVTPTNLTTTPTFTPTPTPTGTATPTAQPTLTPTP